MIDQTKHPENTPMRSDAVEEHEFAARMEALMSEIAELPPAEKERLEKLAVQTQVRHEKMRQTVTKLQDSLDHLRLSVKYLCFDLEATRRENGYLRKLLQEERGEEEM